MYPSGFGAYRHDGVQKVDITLKHCSENGTTARVEYTVRAKDLNGNVKAGMSQKQSFVGTMSSGFLTLVRSEILDPTSNILSDGTLTVELRIKSMESATNTSSATKCQPFVPTNPLCRNIQRLLFDEDTADVLFEISKRQTSSDEGGNNDEIVTFRAHRAILHASAPTLATLCESCDNSTPVPITNVTPDIFELVLRYVYGLCIQAEDWKLHSKELIDAADQYGVINLKLEAEYWYVKMTNVMIDNVVDVLLYAESKHLALLEERVMDYFVENGDEALKLVPFHQIPESRSFFTGLLAAMNVKKGEGGGSVSISTIKHLNYKTARVDELRRRLDDAGYDVDGSREILIGRYEKMLADGNGDENGDEEEIASLTSSRRRSSTLSDGPRH